MSPNELDSVWPGACCSITCTDSLGRDLLSQWLLQNAILLSIVILHNLIGHAELSTVALSTVALFCWGRLEMHCACLYHGVPDEVLPLLKVSPAQAAHPVQFQQMLTAYRYCIRHQLALKKGERCTTYSCAHQAISCLCQQHALLDATMYMA